MEVRDASLESHWKTVAVTIILGLLAWQATKVVSGQERLLSELQGITIQMAEMKVRLEEVRSLRNDVNDIDHRVTILEQHISNGKGKRKE